VSFHGGLLATDKPDSPHLLAPRIKARLYFAIASDDDQREPEVKEKLKEAFAAAQVRAEIEVYPNALHGWCVPDSRAAENKPDAERAWGKLVALYRAALWWPSLRFDRRPGRTDRSASLDGMSTQSKHRVARHYANAEIFARRPAHLCGLPLVFDAALARCS
jgi:hypothetical protein